MSSCCTTKIDSLTVKVVEMIRRLATLHGVTIGTNMPTTRDGIARLERIIDAFPTLNNNDCVPADFKDLQELLK